MTAPLPTKGSPSFAVHTIARTVVLTLGNCARTSDGIGGMFLPDELEIEWRNDVLVDAILSGRRLRSDGNPFLHEKSAWVSFVGDHAPDMPEWVAELISKFQTV